LDPSQRLYGTSCLSPLVSGFFFLPLSCDLFNPRLSHFSRLPSRIRIGAIETLSLTNPPRFFDPFFDFSSCTFPSLCPQLSHAATRPLFSRRSLDVPPLSVFVDSVTYRSSASFFPTGFWKSDDVVSSPLFENAHLYLFSPVPHGLVAVFLLSTPLSRRRASARLLRFLLEFSLFSDLS